MQRPYPKEFREDVVRVAWSREPGVTVEYVGDDFGERAATLWTWLRAEGIEQTGRA